MYPKEYLFTTFQKGNFLGAMISRQNADVLISIVRIIIDDNTCVDISTFESIHSSYDVFSKNYMLITEI